MVHFVTESNLRVQIKRIFSDHDIFIATVIIINIYLYLALKTEKIF